MLKLSVTVPAVPAKHYPILIGSGLLSKLTKVVPAIRLASKIVIITDQTTKKLVGLKLAESLRKQKLKTLLLSVPDGEKSKTQKYKTFLEEAMLKSRCDRHSIILALGGGVVGDLAGFVAATYMRGIPYIQLPTTLLAMVDSSLGGKTGIDTPQGKNLIGAFLQPQAVVADIGCLKNLPRKQLINGFFEAIKKFLTSDKKSFEFVEKRISSVIARSASDEAILSKKEIASAALAMTQKEKVLTKIIKRAAEIKTGVFGRDERETGERMVLNFGHTIGHALEKLSGYKIPHGYSVGMGMLVESKISKNLGILPQKDYDRIEYMITLLGIDLQSLKKRNADKIIKQTLTDKKSKNGKARYVLLKGIGRVHVKNNAFAHFVNQNIVRRSLKPIT